MQRWRVTVAAAVLVAACGAPSAAPEAPVPLGPRLSAEPATAAEQATAAELLAEARAAFDAGDHARARETSEQVVDRYPGTTASVPALWVAAQAALRLGDAEAAAAMGERYAGVFPAGSREAEEASRFLDEVRLAAEAAGRTLILGVILPQTGSTLLRQYAELILEGIRVAVDRTAQELDASIELVVLDDGGDAGRAAARLRELEGRGAMGVIGPLLAPGVLAAAESRSSDNLVIVSPLADLSPWQLPQVYSLAGMDTRGAEALAEHAVQEGFTRVGMLYPRTRTFEQQARAFAEALERAGGRLVADVPYDSGTTTFAEPLGRLTAAAPQALFIPAPERDVRQIAPQLAYYGLRGQGLQVLGNEAWASDDLLRLVEAQHVEGVIAATPFLRGSDALEWDSFVEWYETTHRRTLDNQVPALGYDAARVLLASARYELGPAGVARRMADLAGFRSATGVLSIRDGQVQRVPFLVRIQAREPVPVQASSGG